MFTRPDHLSDAQVRKAFEQGWGCRIDQIEHAAVGFGSHHWRATSDGQRWFLTVDDLAPRGESDTSEHRGRLVAALSTADALRRQLGRSFVVAPIRCLQGQVIVSIDNRYVLAAYHHVDGETGSWGQYTSSTDRCAVVDRLVDIHLARDIDDVVMVDDFVIPSRAALDKALTRLATTWNTGPYGELCRMLLARHTGALQDAFDRYDQLVAIVRQRRDRFTITHGEPHPGNVIFTNDGPALIDWDTALLAPPERDLWSLIDEDPDVAQAYTKRSSLVLDDQALRLYRLRWDLTEVSLYTADFSRPHADNDDTRAGWQGLQRHLDPERWQP